MEPHHLRLSAPLPVNETSHPAAVARWIARNVPNFVGRVPEAWTDAVIKNLDGQNVSEYVIAQALKLVRNHGYDFGDIEFLRAFGSLGWQYKPAPLPANYVAPPAMGPAEPITEAYIAKMADFYEAKYILAVKTDDYSTQAAMLSGFMSFARSVVAAIMMGRKPRENEDRLKAGEQIRNRAPTVSSDADKLERAGVRNPSPQDVRTRIVPMRRPSQGPRTRK